jgi:hypothetical protein
MSARPDIAVLKNVRLSFPKLFKAEKSTDTSAPKFSAAFLIDPDTAEGKANIKAINAAIEHAKTKTWADKAEKIYANIDWDRKPLRDGNKATNAEGDIYAGYEDMMFVQASSAEKRRPQTLKRDKSPTVEEDNILYGGCYVDAVVSVYPITDKDKGGNGVFASIEVVRFRRDGEPFGAGAVDADDYLDDLEEEDDDLV